jgi:hypothetical protein
MLTAVIIPREANLHLALRTRGARQAIDAGFGLYTDGERTLVIADPPADRVPELERVRDGDGERATAGCVLERVADGTRVPICERALLRLPVALEMETLRLIKAASATFSCQSTWRRVRRHSSAGAMRTKAAATQASASTI